MQSLADHHRAMLETDSGITRGWHERRGCFTATNPGQLKDRGFSPDQSLAAPALVLPTWSIEGAIRLHQMRPDAPRIIDGKPSKYECQAGGKPCVDVHPDIRDRVLDVRVPLFLTEGVRKSDCYNCRATPEQGVCIALLGVWMFAAANDSGGVCDLPCWSQIPWRGKHVDSRPVFIAYDSDIVDKPSVELALKALCKMLKGRGAHVMPVRIPERVKS